MTAQTVNERASVLRIDASMRKDGSVTRSLADRLLKRLTEIGAAGAVQHRDLADGAPKPVDAAWIGANFTAADERSADQQDVLAESDALVEELKRADTVVITVPIYNFGVPAALKAWVDQVARARVTFKYTGNGPVGLLDGKKAYLVVASGGTPVESEIDFATGYMKHILGFIGIHDVTVIGAGRTMADAKSVAAAEAQIDAIGATAQAA
ncbi:MAG: NAD(P)H-dependent oxidoreductase [Alphaproteobacteria bacterium]|nr:NAD(P)H-dependent oxidoreductase [Alphaproteobacteria bacterium]